MKLRLCPLAAIMFAALASPLAAAPPAPQDPCNVVEIWVDPVHGNDGTGSPDPNCGSGGGGIGHEVVRINNPAAPTKTIQVAIDIAAKYLRCNYDSVENPDQEAIVHLLPGIYGPATDFNGEVGNDEIFPIVMHDRVHVRGVNARRCVIRGVNTQDLEYGANLKSGVLWPDVGTCSSDPYDDRQVLVDFSLSGYYRFDGGAPEYHPWASDPDYGETAEMLDSVTLQGGDVQVLFGYLRELPWPLQGRIANCLFDLRHDFAIEKGENLSAPKLTGAWIGLMVQTTWTDDILPLSGDVEINGIGGNAGSGYLLQEVASIGNTFLMAEFVWNGSQGFWLRSRPGAVGILDTADPICGGGGGGSPGDPLQVIRGVNRLGVQNTLLRTHSQGASAGTAEMAMVGVSFDDANVSTGAQFVDTNAFAIARAGATSSVFTSPPYAQGAQTGTITYQPLGKTWPLYACNVPSTPPQTPAVKHWDGDGSAGTQFDPAFVGEHLRTVSPVMGTYRDWRLLPGSPLQNQGFSGTVSTFQSGAEFEEPECDPLKVMKWDHEQFGNLRVVDNAPDIGFDEVQLGVMAGSYANHSLSHNRAGVLNPQVQNEQETRFLFLRQTAPVTGNPLQGRTITLRSNEIVAGTSFRAWTEPPGSLSSPTSVAGPPAGYEFLYTSVSNPVGWMGSYTAPVPAPIGQWPNWQAAPGQLVISLTLVQFPFDDEGGGFASWVNVQPVVTGTGVPALLGSMQPEFR